MSLQLTMINNRKHATPIKVKSPKLVTRISFLGKKMRLLCILGRFCNLVWRAPIPFLSSFRKHRYLFQGPNSTKTHSGITPLNFRPFSLKRIILVCNKERLWNTMQAPRYSGVTETHSFPAFWVSDFKILYTKIHKLSYIQIKTS